MKDFFHPVDIIALVITLGAFALIILRIDQAIATTLLTVVVAYYLGLKTAIVTPEDINCDQKPKV